MSDLTERLIALRDALNGVNPDHLTDRAYASLERDRDTLAEAANRIAELEAERDRYREALKQIASHDQPLDFDDMGCARAALNPEDDDDE